MEPYQTLEEKIEACISTLLRKEFPYTHTSDINGAAALGAVQVANDILARKNARRTGVRPLQLLELPAEIRNRIYEYAVKLYDTQRKDIIRMGAGKSMYFDSNPAAQPAITRVSRQLRKDTLSMFYNVNDFAVQALPINAADIRDGSSQVCRWLRCIGAEKAHMIKNFTVYWYDGAPFGTASAARINQLMVGSELATLAPVAKVKGARTPIEFSSMTALL
ncbi:hypothetical protein LTR97_002683 [Elasticomyces elasticus]|uniref:Uncharacterized protein n=1 Tax=Elasticomyces elasticus TaxID=574655 RepID=A0AAN7ZQ81_9PEZI|nr:hypothetical protein LTR97_002683 [Elasticomyces elasticus]